MTFKVAVHLSDNLRNNKDEIEAFLNSKTEATLYIQDTRVKPEEGTDCVIRLISKEEEGEIEFYKDFFAAYKNRVYAYKDTTSLNETYTELMKDLSATKTV